MRYAIISLLLLGTAVPALAAEPDSLMKRVMERRAEQREARQEQRPERVERRSDRSDEAPHAERRERPVAVNNDAPAEVREPRERRRERVASPVITNEAQAQAQPADSVRDWRRQERAADRVRRNREDRTASAAGAIPGTGAPIGAQGRTGDERVFDRLRDRVAAEGWRQEWRRDRRYDWRHYRDRDRSRFRIGFYIDPFGWNYRPWQLGGYLPSRFYRSSYWLDDPWQYRLPPAYGPYRWIRYYDDVLLIDMRSGRIVDRIPNFFW